MTEQVFDPAMTARPRTARNWLAGRGARKEYWTAIGVIFAISLVLGLVTKLSGIGSGNASSFTGVPMMLLMVRRLHDINRSGWWSLAISVGPVVPMLAMMPFVPMTVLVPFVMLLSGVWTIWLGAIPGDAHENRFGPPPGRPDLKEVFS